MKHFTIVYDSFSRHVYSAQFQVRAWDMEWAEYMFHKAMQVLYRDYNVEVLAVIG